MKWHIHDWEKIKVENSELDFQLYIENLYKERLINDFKGVLKNKEMIFPKGITNKDNFSPHVNVDLEIDFWFYENEYPAIISPKVWICLKCMKYKSDLFRGTIQRALKNIYKDYYKRNMIKYIQKFKKVKLTVNRINENEDVGNLDSLNVILKQFNNIHQKEAELLKAIKIF